MSLDFLHLCLVEAQYLIMAELVHLIGNLLLLLGLNVDIGLSLLHAW